MSTTNKTQGESTTGAQGFGWQSGIADSMRDLMGFQMRTAQFVMDRTIGFGQAMTDFCQNQWTETMKVSQECTKYSWSFTENLKKSAFEHSERTFRGFNN